jgi:hypothetical protein
MWILGECTFMHGHGKDSFKKFEHMHEKGVFICLLSTCSHVNTMDFFLPIFLIMWLIE